ncbi:acyl-CoA dehydrogenase family protein [Saccharopolyspora sp. NFXS83]|uniref:acyl-CoA dehydrogenase family protein n=1 Tax=Saccharopolyspora sp. NFXS83 TaxID=2993560 RepID=UPI00224B1722|nr:acyl-CoA dehydrogenase family protein [Saccharopolyspora sp. NFXS83]MCX2730340.1 acyl-CoA dehydrogenase family protein [Saccharopolyspora sp. NFXS83]
MNDALLAEVAADVLGSATPQDADDRLPEVWTTMAELEWPLVSIPEGSGGAGGSVADLLALVGAVAEHGLSAPLAEAALARWALAAAGRADLPGLVLPAWEDDTGVPRGTGWARHARNLVVWPRTGPAYLADMATARVFPGTNLAAEPRDTVAVGAGARTPLPDAPARSAAVDRAALLNAAAITGAARGAHEITRLHVTRREQFGRPLIALKAVANSLARMRAELVSTRAALDRACTAHTEDPARARPATATAKIRAARAATSIARDAHQLHGAMGVTREHSLHHVTRKLWAWRDEHGAEREWSAWLGRTALAAGEDELWEHLTA